MTAWNLRSAEFVWPGHPDKIADAIADRIVDAGRRLHPRTLVGIEVAVHQDRVFVDGRVGGPGSSSLDIDGIVRQTFAELGYSQVFCPAPEDLRIDTDLRLDDLFPGETEYREVSDDQAIITGWATTRLGTHGLPCEHALARHIAIGLWRLRIDRPELGLGPDGKIFVTIRENDDGSSCAVDDVTASIQHTDDWDGTSALGILGQTVLQLLHQFANGVPGFYIPGDWALNINPLGDFIDGGPWGDNGLSGKKLVADFYGPRVPIGGGAMSGKDFWKVDRAGPLIARDLANIAAHHFGLGECLVTLGIRPGDRAFRVIRVEDENRTAIDVARAQSLTDLRLKSRGNWPASNGPLEEVARWGHFAPLPGFQGASLTTTTTVAA